MTILPHNWHAQQAASWKRYTPVPQVASRVLAYISRFQAEHGGVTPAFTDIQAACNISSKSGVARALKHLEAEGRIRRIPYRARAIEVIPQLSYPDAQVFIWDDEAKELKPLKRK